MVTTGQSTAVFVVERDVHVRRFLAEFLLAAGCTPHFLDDGYKALDLARRGAPALLITEILVPRLDGLTLCRLVKADAATQETKVMVLSVLAAEARSLLAGADRFMQKPIERNAFIDVVRHLVAPQTEEAVP